MMKIDPNEVREYLSHCGPNTKIYLGADSERFRQHGVWHADYMLVCVIHIDGSKGCKIFGEIQREIDYDAKASRPAMRLMTEVYKVSELYSRLLEPILEAGFADIEIHLDINSDDTAVSNMVISQAVGYIKATCNVVPLCKPHSPAASFCADHLKLILQNQGRKMEPISA